MKRAKSKKTATIKSPCRAVCQYIENTNICCGCGRTSDEIVEWYTADDTRRTEIIDSAKQRLKNHI